MGLTRFPKEHIRNKTSLAGSVESRKRSEGPPRTRDTMAPFASSLVERREAPPPTSLGGACLREARGGPDGPSGPTSLGPAPPGAPFPRLEGDGKRGKGGPGSPKSEAAGRHGVG